MAFRVFLSHSLDPEEMALAWRLQTLAAAHGIEMYVPNRGTSAAAARAAAIEQAIDRADCVLAIMTAAAGENVQHELRYALDRGKLVVPIVGADLAGSTFLAQFPRVFQFAPWDNPGAVETQIVEFLKEQHVSKSGLQAVSALAALGLGLMVLFSMSKER